MVKSQTHVIPHQLIPSFFLADEVRVITPVLVGGRMIFGIGDGGRREGVL